MTVKKNIQSAIGLISQKVSLKLLMDLSGQKLIMPFYHTVSNGYLPHISALYKPKTSREFENDLDFFLKYYNPVCLDDLKTGVALKSKKPVFFLSFDDGLKESKSIIAPILKRKGIPATFFVNSAFIDNRSLFFRYKTSLLVDAFQNKKKLKSAKKDICEILNVPNTDNNKIVSAILNLKYHQQKIINELAIILEVDFIEYLKTAQPYLSSEEIKKLQNEGFSIGAHSIDHPEFRFIPLEEQLRQTKESLLFVRQNFMPDILSFSFPFTDYAVEKLFFSKLKNMDICDLSFACAGLKHDSISDHFQRIPMEDERGTAEQAIKFEYFYFILKSVIAKNNISRE
ncbi:MAG: polysaccharide deacetylase family protein [Bacteroidota bacterium]|nr:polysaccharide deacetylase family protein [Bacteroidota bacterium]